MFIDFGDVFLYIFFFLFAASLCFGFIWSLKNDKPAYSVKIPASQKRPLPPQSVAAALLVVCIVYVFFAAVQFKYLFSSYNTLMQTPGLTSAAYAVRGFAELIVITLINFALLGLSMNFTRPEGKQVFLKILYFILILFNFVILYSSHLRLSLYEHSFGVYGRAVFAASVPHLLCPAQYRDASKEFHPAHARVQMHADRIPRFLHLHQFHRFGPHGGQSEHQPL